MYPDTAALQHCRLAKHCVGDAYYYHGDMEYNGELVYNNRVCCTPISAANAQLAISMAPESIDLFRTIGNRRLALCQ